MFSFHTRTQRQGVLFSLRLILLSGPPYVLACEAECRNAQIIQTFTQTVCQQNLNLQQLQITNYIKRVINQLNSSPLFVFVSMIVITVHIEFRSPTSLLKIPRIPLKITFFVGDWWHWKSQKLQNLRLRIKCY